jgi:signal transduction histidine kinase
VYAGDGVKVSAKERILDWFRMVHFNFQRLYPWVLFMPYVLWLSSRFNFERPKLAKNICVHVAACLVFVLASQTINSRISMKAGRMVVITSHEETFRSNSPTQDLTRVRVEVSGEGGASLVREEHIQTNLRGNGRLMAGGAGAGYDPMNFMPTNLLPRIQDVLKPPGPHGGPLALRPLATLLDLFAYASLAGMAHAVHFYRRFRERERRALFLEAHLTRARLSALQAQLQPHFLFNTLNAIAALLRRDPRAAETTITSLSELLRMALSQSEKQEISLREELQMLERYVEIQQTRFGPRLRFEQSIAPDTLDCLVPTLLLQPLVENAVQHGLEPSSEPGTVKVVAAREKDSLMIAVQDNGVGLNPAQPGRGKSGIGLTNLKARLQSLYGENQTFQIGPGQSGGVDVKVLIPLRFESVTQTS